MAETDSIQITSAQNPRIKRLISLQQKSSERRAQGLFVVEGKREILHFIERYGSEIHELYYCPEMCELPHPLYKSGATVEVSRNVYEKIAYRGSTEGIIAVCSVKPFGLNNITLKENPLIIVLEGVEKPGNIGAILRSADAAGADAVIVCDPLTDLYNPNIIRSSIGACFTKQFTACTTDECIDFLKKKGIQILTAQLQDSTPYYNQDMKQGTAIVMGTEDKGLTDKWRQAADAHIRIPMLGQLDSLNVSVSAAILMYEAVRQRNNETSHNETSK